jgi:hypothetical protein
MFGFQVGWSKSNVGFSEFINPLSKFYLAARAYYYNTNHHTINILSLIAERKIIKKQGVGKTASNFLVVL